MAWYVMALIVFEVFNLALIIGGFLLIAKIYSSRFSKLTSLVGDALAARDMAFRKLQANLAHAFVTDTSVFDTALEDLSDADLPAGLRKKRNDDGNEKADSAGA